jgi:hypothetical protein
MAEREQKKPAPAREDTESSRRPATVRVGREDQGRARRPARRDRRGPRDQRRGLREVLHPEGRRVARRVAGEEACPAVAGPLPSPFGREPPEFSHTTTRARASPRCCTTPGSCPPAPDRPVDAAPRDHPRHDVSWRSATPTASSWPATAGPPPATSSATARSRRSSPPTATPAWPSPAPPAGGGDGEALPAPARALREGRGHAAQPRGQGQPAVPDGAQPPARRHAGPRRGAALRRLRHRRRAGRLFQYDVTGGRYEEQNHAATGSGSLHAGTVVKLGWREGLDRTDAAPSTSPSPPSSRPPTRTPPPAAPTWSGASTPRSPPSPPRASSGSTTPRSPPLPGRSSADLTSARRRGPPGTEGRHRHEHAVLRRPRAGDEGPGRLRPQGHRPGPQPGRPHLRRRHPHLRREPVSTLRKISEIYDRIAFAGVGKYNEFDQLRIAGVRHADLKGYSYSREDVDARSLANQYAQILGQIFTHEMKPMEVEILVAEVGSTTRRRPAVPHPLRRHRHRRASGHRARRRGRGDPHPARGRLARGRARPSGRALRSRVGRSPARTASSGPAELEVAVLDRGQRPADRSGASRATSSPSSRPQRPRPPGLTATAGRRRLSMSTRCGVAGDRLTAPWSAHLRARERVRRHLHPARPAPAQPRRGGPLPVPAGRVVGPQLQRVPGQRRPAVPRRRLAPRVRHPRVRLGARPGGARQGGGADPRAAPGQRRAAPAEEGIRGDIYLFKNNTDSAGNSYGCHENYLTSRRDDFNHYAEVLIPFLVSRQIYAGAGKVLQTARGAMYCISQRAEHIWEGVSSATTRSRPDHQHPRRAPRRRRALPPAARDRRRLQHERVRHLPQGGRLRILLRMLEDPGVVLRDMTLENPIRAIREISHDITCTRRVRLANGREASALEIQGEYLERALRYAETRGLSPRRSRRSRCGSTASPASRRPAQPRPRVRLGHQAQAHRGLPRAPRPAALHPRWRCSTCSTTTSTAPRPVLQDAGAEAWSSGSCTDAEINHAVEHPPRPPGPGCGASSSAGPRSASATTPSTGST